MNSAIHNADRATHMRIVALALIAAIAVTGFAISVRLSAGGGMQANLNTSHALKAQVFGIQPTAASSYAIRPI
jgi:hypothetical protein